MQLLTPISSFEELMARLPGLHPEGHHVLVNLQHPLVAGDVDQLSRLVAGAQAGVFDFDGTLHASNQWTVARDWMLPEDSEADLKDLNAYFNLPNHDDAENVAFILRSVDRIRRNAGRFDDLRMQMCSVPPRRGAGKLLQSFPKTHLAVITFGLHHLTAAWLVAHVPELNLGYYEVFGLKLNWGRGPAEPILATVVTDGNKGFLRRAFCGARGIPAEKTLVVADSPTDILMMGHDVVGCFLMPKVDPQIGRDAHRRARMQEMWSASACMVVSDDLTPILDMRQEK